MIKKMNKIGVWERGVSKGLKAYDQKHMNMTKMLLRKLRKCNQNLRKMVTIYLNTIWIF